MNKKTTTSSAPAGAPVLRLAPVITPIRQSAPYGRYSQECIEAAESLLKKAKSGEVCGFSIATFYSDSTCDAETIGASGDWSIQTIGLLELLKARLINQIDKP